MDEKILVGIFGAPHGVRGEIRLKSYMEDPLALADLKSLSGAAGQSFRLTAARPLKDDMLVVRIEGVADRDAAAALTHQKIFVARDALPPAEEDEFYCADLIGLRAETADGALLGTVIAVPNYGAGDILEIAPPFGDTLLFPFTRAVVPEIDLAAKKLIVAPPVQDDAREEDAREEDVREDDA